MITKNEISSLNLSPTKKDFVQIWNELIEVASKITERWDPTSTNESDPGIVLLKVLTGIADKLNYNIDKNILEAYMPTAAQMESMRKLCELVGYDIKYYQSAETRVRISYTGNIEDPEEALPATGLAIPKFTTITNADKDITFVTTNPVPMLLHNDTPWVDVPCIEGQVSQCESTNENNLITLSQLDTSNRYYLPEIQIAENGIFVYNASIDLTDGTLWTQVSNLNTQPPNSRVFKFGYDSLEGRPYLAFPEDIGSLIGEGLFIYFIRTSGLSGNISPRTLEVLEIPTGADWDKHSAEQFEVVNVNATTNGANIEGISAAYNNFKKTIGTFDTLVTCRDYMNKIYSLMDVDNSPYVSNILVTDIRNDINNAITLCSCNEFGILYKETPLTKTISGVPVVSESGKATRAVADANTDINRIILNQNHEVLVDDKKNNRLIINQTEDEPITNGEVPLIDHFDLLLYPFKTFTQVSASTSEKGLISSYEESFTFTNRHIKSGEFEAALADVKTCAHKFRGPDPYNIAAINNYLRLDALIATSSKVSEIEAKSIIHNVKVALVNEFNLRNLDFGEEIPFDSILSVIENADPRIKVVSLQEPTVLTTYSVIDQDGSTSKEYGIASGGKQIQGGVNYEDSKTARDIYNRLVLRNILAGRASLFDYDEAFVANNSERPYSVTKDITELVNKEYSENDSDEDKAAKAIADAIKKAIEVYTEPGDHVLYNTNEDGTTSPITGFSGGTVSLRVSEITTTDETVPKKRTTDETLATTIKKTVYETYEPFEHGVIGDIKRVEAVCEIRSTNNTFKNIKLEKNEVIKFRAPNLITTKTFPAYVYYRFERAAQAGNDASGNINDDGSYATAVSLKSFINGVGTVKFFTKLWSDNSSKLLAFEWEKSDGPKLDQSGQLPSILNSAIVVYTDDGVYEEVTKGTTNAIEYEEKYYTYKSGRTLCVDSSGINLYVALSDIRGATEVTFKYYPLNTGTMTDWGNCVKAFETLPGDTVFWRLSQTSSFSKGRLVNQYGQRLYAQTGDYLMNSSVGDVTYICKNLGSDPVYYSIPKDSDIELRPGDKLYIHYTPSSTNEDGETVDAEAVSIVYSGDDEDPVILKPSFELIPSNDVNKQGTSWKKTDVDFGVHGKKNLLSLAPNEQIEIRSISKVVLDKPARFYRNFETTNLNGYELKDGEYIFYTDMNTQEAAYYGSGSVITLDGALANIPSPTETVEISQILSQGLHIIPWGDYIPLSSDNKITITEYQYVTLTEGDRLDTLSVVENDVSDSYTINNTSWTRCLNPVEQPITYTRADSENSSTLPRIELSSGPSTSWEVCSFLELSTAPGYAQPLRAAATEIKTTNAEGISEDAEVSITDQIKLYIDSGTGIEPAGVIAPVETLIGDKTVFEQVSIKLDTIAQTASGNFEKSENTQEPESSEKSSSKIQMKVFKEESPSLIVLKDIDETITPISGKSLVPADPANINNYWSAIDIANKLASEDQPKALKLNFMIPNDDMFGIFSIYLSTSEDQKNQANAGVFIDIPKEFGSYKNVVSIYNYNKTIDDITYYWWPEGVASPNRLYLRAGLNCIKVMKSCSLLIKAEPNAIGSIIYDNMRLVKGCRTEGINLNLIDYNAVALSGKTSTDAEKEDYAAQLLKNIAALDKNYEFYYNAPIENSLAMEFDDNNISSFSNPYTLYDINNVNNAFVISKLDVRYLDTGLKIAKSSRY